MFLASAEAALRPKPDFNEPSESSTKGLLDDTLKSDLGLNMASAEAKNMKKRTFFKLIWIKHRVFCQIPTEAENTHLRFLHFRMPLGVVENLAPILGRSPSATHTKKFQKTEN